MFGGLDQGKSGLTIGRLKGYVVLVWSITAPAVEIRGCKNPRSLDGRRIEGILAPQCHVCSTTQGRTLCGDDYYRVVGVGYL